MPYPPLSLAQRTELSNDPRMKDPAIRMQVFAKISPEDQQWLTAAMKTGDQPIDAPGMLKEGITGAANYVKNNPRKVGATVGGIVLPIATGGASLPIEIAAAGVGGMGGAGLGITADTLRQYFGGAPSSETLPTTGDEAAAAMLKEGTGQMLGQAMGGLTKLGMQGGANVLMNESVPTDIAKEFPENNIGGWLNEHGINPTTKSGAAKARLVRRTAGAEQRGLATQATASGTPGITRADLTPYLSNANREASEQAAAGVNPSAPQTVTDTVDRLFNAQPIAANPAVPAGLQREMPLSQAPASTRQWQRSGKIVRKAVNAGNLSSDIEAITSDDMANGIRRVTADRVPGYADAAKAAQDAVGGARVAEKMSKMPIRVGGWPARISAGGLATGGVLSGNPLAGFASAAVPLALGTPQVSAPLALAAYRAGKLPYDMLIKAVSPQVLEMLGITPPNLAGQAAGQ